MKRMGKRFEERKGFACKIVALGLFFADREQAHARVFNLEHGAGVHFAHNRELLKVVRLAIHVRAHIEQNAGMAGGAGHWRGKRGPIDAGQCGEHHFGRSHGCAGIAGGHESCGLALAHQLEPYAH